MNRWFWPATWALSALFCLICAVYALGLFGGQAQIAPESAFPIAYHAGSLRPYRALGTPSFQAVDINAVPAHLLLLLPGLSAGVKEGILRLREELGAFRSLDELSLVSGVGPATLEKLYTLFYIRPSMPDGNYKNAIWGRIEELQ